MRPIRRGALAALLLLGAAACGDDGGGGGSGGGGSLATFRDALAAVPADDLAEGALITWADLDAATDAAGLERPEAGDGEALVDWLLALTGEEDSVVMVPFADTLQIQSINGRAAEFEAELGWTVADVDAFVELSAPPARFFVGAGDLGVDGEDLVELGDGILTAGEGEDLATDLAGGTAARPLGAPLRLAEDGGLLAASARTEPLQAWVSGSGDRLAQDDGLAAVAAAVDEAGAVSAVAVRTTPASIPWSYDTAAIGWAVDPDGEPVITIAFHLAEPEEADEAAEALEEALRTGELATSSERLAEYLEVVEVTADDGVLVATLRLGPEGNVRHPMLMLSRQDLPFR